MHRPGVTFIQTRAIYDDRRTISWYLKTEKQKKNRVITMVCLQCPRIFVAGGAFTIYPAAAAAASPNFKAAPSQQFTIMRTFHSERQNRVFVQDRKKQDYQNYQDFQNYQRVFVKVRSRKQDSQTIPSGDSVCRCIVSLCGLILNADVN